MPAMTLCVGVDGEPCDELVARGTCPECEAKHKAMRNQRYGKKRDTHVEKTERHWRMIRANYLRKNPECAHEDCTDPATDVHHVIEREDGGDSTDGNLEGLCKHHHRSISAKRQVRVVRRAA
jgi:5-methylcytosine-specific restriction endonuclease McrA